MKKKAYMKPEMSLLVMETAEVIAYSGGSESVGLNISEEADKTESTVDNRSRGLWGIGDEEW